MTESSRPVVLLSFIHGVYYLLSGVWALVDIESFMLVTGPKIDVWLVRTVAGFITTTGAGLLCCASRRVVPVEVALIAVAQCLLLAAISIVYVLQSTLSAIYLFDAILELVVVLAWCIVLYRDRRI